MVVRNHKVIVELLLGMFKQSHDPEFAAQRFSMNQERGKSKEAPETLFDVDALEFPATTRSMFLHLTWMKTLVSIKNDTLSLKRFNDA